MDNLPKVPIDEISKIQIRPFCAHYSLPETDPLHCKSVDRFIFAVKGSPFCSDCKQRMSRIRQAAERIDGKKRENIRNDFYLENLKTERNIRQWNEFEVELQSQSKRENELSASLNTKKLKLIESVSKDPYLSKIISPYYAPSPCIPGINILPRDSNLNVSSPESIEKYVEESEKEKNSLREEIKLLKEERQNIIKETEKRIMGKFLEEEKHDAKDTFDDFTHDSVPQLYPNLKNANEKTLDLQNARKQSKGSMFSDFFYYFNN